VLFEVLRDGRDSIAHFLICDFQSPNCWLICKDPNDLHRCWTGSLLLLLVFTHLGSDVGELHTLLSINSVIYRNTRRPRGLVTAPAKQPRTRIGNPAAYTCHILARVNDELNEVYTLKQFVAHCESKKSEKKEYRGNS
jgi:hypothetical protein